MVRAYAKVMLGWRMLCLDFFEPKASEERAIKQSIDAILAEHPNAVASVSRKCKHALKDLPVIGDFPDAMKSEFEGRHRLTSNQRRLLQSACAEGGVVVAAGHVGRSAVSLLDNGFIEEVGDRWVATLAGRIKVGAMHEEEAA